MNSIFVIVALLFIMLPVALAVLIYRVKKRKTTDVREQYAFKSVSLLIALAVNLVTVFCTNDSFWSIAASLLRLDTTEAPIVSVVSRALATIVFIACCFVVYRTYGAWDGNISRRQYRINLQEMSDSGLLVDFVVVMHSLYKKNYELKAFQRYSEQINFSENYITGELPWHVEFARIFSITSNQAKIDLQRDWHAQNRCFIAPYSADHLVAIYCPIELPTKEESIRFLDYIHRLNKQYLEIIIAVRENPEKLADYIEHQSNEEIKYRFKNNALNTLVDFTEYADAIETLYHRPLLPDAKLAIDDVYVELNCSVGGHLKRCSLQGHVNEWLRQTESRQLALLGEFGQGKTLFATHLTYHMLKEHTERIPLLIPLKNKSPRNSNPLEILSYFSSQYGINPEALSLLNANGKLLLIFDGFDEMDLVGNDDIRKMHFKSLWKLVTPKSKVLITGRPNYFLNPSELRSALGIQSGSNEIPFCEDLYLLPFDPEQIMQALRNAGQSVQKGIRHIIDNQASDSFLDLISRPSQLFWVSQIWDERNLANKYRNLTSATIINEFLLSCFARQRDKGERNPYFFLSPIEREYFMVGVAIKMYKLGMTVITNDLLCNTISELIDLFPDRLSSENSMYLNLRNGKSVKAFAQEDVNSLYAIINDVRICGVLVNDYVNDGVVFAHKSFYDLLVAKYFLGKNIKFHDTAMTISTALSSFNAYNARLKKDIVIRKMLAELISSQISIRLESSSDETKCRKIFDQCHKVIAHLPWQSTPQKLFAQCLRYDSRNTISMKRLVKDRGETSRMLVVFLLFPLSIALFVARDLSLIHSLGEQARDLYATFSIENSHYTFIGQFLGDSGLGFELMVVAILALLALIVILVTKGGTYQADIILLTWYYTCLENNIPKRTIYQFIPLKWRGLFSAYIQGRNLTVIQEKLRNKRRKIFRKK